MKNLLITPPQFITRTVLQTMLHRALAAGESLTCTGVLGVSQGAVNTIQYIEVISSDSALGIVLASWKKAEVRCIGCFRLQHQSVSKNMLDMMPDDYTELSVRLDEVGRLDILAHQHDKTTQDTSVLSLNLIEDGHAVVDE